VGAGGLFSLLFDAAAQPATTRRTAVGMPGGDASPLRQAEPLDAPESIFVERVRDDFELTMARQGVVTPIMRTS